MFRVRKRWRCIQPQEFVRQVLVLPSVWKNKLKGKIRSRFGYTHALPVPYRRDSWPTSVSQSADGEPQPTPTSPWRREVLREGGCSCRVVAVVGEVEVAFELPGWEDGGREGNPRSKEHSKQQQQQQQQRRRPATDTVLSNRNSIKHWSAIASPRPQNSLVDAVIGINRAERTREGQGRPTRMYLPPQPPIYTRGFVVRRTVTRDSQGNGTSNDPR